MPEFKVRYLVLTKPHDYDVRPTPSEKQTIVEKINAETVEKARAKADELATIRSKKTEKWLVKAIEQIN